MLSWIWIYIYIYADVCCLLPISISNLVLLPCSIFPQVKLQHELCIVFHLSTGHAATWIVYHAPSFHRTCCNMNCVPCNACSIFPQVMLQHELCTMLHLSTGQAATWIVYHVMHVPSFHRSCCNMNCVPCNACSIFPQVMLQHELCTMLHLSTGQAATWIVYHVMHVPSFHRSCCNMNCVPCNACSIFPQVMLQHELCTM